ncbi:hypothetical protein [Rhodopirellula halodulae]|uniref:hypothetical protein n=1 Tax=Rhodopirellula halodulae TaxID=2894198 RepID=UPI001E479E88|nr:hypothetical protein [Rhodopirellula sp. JC737]MCC9654901.1 hypothetical protein [Rhodopirellula sp. JC737]
MIVNTTNALPRPSGSPLFNEAGTMVVSLAAWRTDDGYGLTMKIVAVRSFVPGEVAEAESELAVLLIHRVCVAIRHGSTPCRSALLRSVDAFGLAVSRQRDRSKVNPDCH